MNFAESEANESARARQDIDQVRLHLNALRGGLVRDHMLATLALLESTLQRTSGDQNRAPASADAVTSAPAVLKAEGLGGKAEGLLEKANVPAVTELHSLALVLHCLLLEKGFIATHVEDSGKPALRGFAPPVRDLPNGQLVPPQWNQQKGVASFTYRHPSLNGKEHQLTVVEVESTAQVHFGEKTGEVSYADLSVSEYGEAQKGNKETGKAYYDKLRKTIEGLVYEVCPILAPKSQTPSAENTNTNRITEERSRPQQQQRGDTYDPMRIGPERRPRFEPPPYGMGPGVPPGGFIPVGGPGNGGDFSGDLAPGGGPWGGGGLMGPNHPAFGLPPGTGLPQPRFDPYGPPPSGLWRGPEPPGQGRGRGRGGNMFGDPNPDHLPPPGGFGGGDMYM